MLCVNYISIKWGEKRSGSKNKKKLAFTSSLNIDREPLFLSTLEDLSQILGRLVWFPGWNCDTVGAESLVAADKPVNRVSGSPGKHKSAQHWHPWHWAPEETWPVAEVNKGRRASHAVGGRPWGACQHVPTNPTHQAPPSPAEVDQPLQLWPQRVDFTTWELISRWFW